MGRLSAPTFNTSVPLRHEPVMSGPASANECCEPYAMEPATPQLGGNVNARNQVWLQLGSHWNALEALQAKSALKRVINEGKSKMNSAHVLNVFSKFEDDDWDRALIIWWQVLAAVSFFGGAISAAVWA